MIELLLIGLLTQTPEPQVITCTVTTSSTVTCPVRNPIPECDKSKHRYCKSIVVPVADWEHPVFSEWMLQAGSWNFPLTKVTPRVGDKLKAEFIDGKVFALATCDVRVHRRVNEWAAAHPGDRVPFTIMEPPKDCGGSR